MIIWHVIETHGFDGQEIHGSFQHKLRALMEAEKLVNKADEGHERINELEWRNVVGASFVVVEGELL
jgi:hypothetical protein